MCPGFFQTETNPHFLKCYHWITTYQEHQLEWEMAPIKTIPIIKYVIIYICQKPINEDNINIYIDGIINEYKMNHMNDNNQILVK